METWLPAPGFDDYEVSSEGRVRRSTPGRATWPGRVLTCRSDSSGYAFSQTGPARCRTRFWVHILVAEAFVGPRPPGMLVNHINGVRTDNRAVNLEWVTPAKNAPRGEAVKGARLNHQAVSVIRWALTHRGRSNSLLARLHHVTAETVRKIRVGKTWGGVPSAG